MVNSRISDDELLLTLFVSLITSFTTLGFAGKSGHVLSNLSMPIKRPLPYWVSGCAGQDAAQSIVARDSRQKSLDGFCI
jgi:hypothetical protein